MTGQNGINAGKIDRDSGDDASHSHPADAPEQRSLDARPWRRAEGLTTRADDYVPDAVQDRKNQRDGTDDSQTWPAANERAPW